MLPVVNWQINLNAFLSDTGFLKHEVVVYIVYFCAIDEARRTHKTSHQKGNGTL